MTPAAVLALVMAQLMAARTGAENARRMAAGIGPGALPGVVFGTDVLWNVFGARLFPFQRSRAFHLSLKTAIDRTFGGLPGVLGLKVALT